MSTFSSTTIVFLDLYHGAYLSPCVRQRKMHFSSIIYASISGYVDCCFPEIPASENTKTVQNVRLPAHRYRPVSGCVLGRPAVLRKYIPYSTRYSAAYVHETHGQEEETPRANKTDLPPKSNSVQQGIGIDRRNHFFYFLASQRMSCLWIPRFRIVASLTAMLTSR